MMKKIKLVLLIIIFFSSFNLVYSVENFFEEAKKKFNEKKLEDLKIFIPKEYYI